MFSITIGVALIGALFLAILRMPDHENLQAIGIIVLLWFAGIEFILPYSYLLMNVLFTIGLVIVSGGYFIYKDRKAPEVNVIIRKNPLAWLIRNGKGRERLSGLSLGVRSQKISQLYGSSTTSLLLQGFTLYDEEEIAFNFTLQGNPLMLYLIPKMLHLEKRGSQYWSWGPFPIEWNANHDLELTLWADNIRKTVKNYNFMPKTEDDLELTETKKQFFKRN